ncbi:phage tail tape measure protein [Fusobacterium hwasookii]|uniref:phage tail tape measure protein n=1 Tax=Fusobacterium hwasookii TaxID=1583098 RepID=UPI001F1CD558|nr:phage tail tape measure protein [Fusobacterium hwasookii]
MILLGKKMDLIMRVQGVIDKSLPGNLKKLANEVKNLRVARQKMEKAQRTLKAQKELNKEIMNNVSKYRKLRNELKALDEIKKRNNSLTDAEKKKYESLTKKAKALETTIKAQSKSFQKYGMELKKLKIPFDNLQSEIDQTIKKEKQLLAQQAAFKSAKGTFKNVKDKFNTGLKYAATAGIVATVGVGISSAKEYLEFDKQMIKVKALTGATAEEYEALKKKAMEVGKTTIFTSEEAAAGMEKFALAGFKPKEIIAAIPPIFDLATASGEDFIMISDMISDHMNAFNIGINDVGHAADILANTMSRSNTNIQMLGEAFKYVSSSAHDLNIDLATASAAVGLMGDQAIKSGQAGRDLKQAFAKIADSKVQKDLQKLGINVKNSKGEFIGLVDFVRQLEKVTGKMSGIEKLAFLKEMFGDQGALAMNKLLTATKEVNGVMYQGADALAQFAKENENATGKAKEMANTILDSDSGKWALLESAISDVKIKIGQAIFTKGGRQLLDIAIEWLNELSNVLSGNFNDTKANKFWQSFIENGKIFLDALVKIGTALWGIFTILNKIGIDKILIFLTILNVLSKIVQFVTVIIPIIKVVWIVISAIGSAIAVVAGVIYLVIKYWDEIKAFVKAIPGFLVEFFTGVWNVLSGVIGAIWQGIVDLFNWILNKITWLWDKIVGVFSTLWSVLTKIFSAIWDKVTGFFQGLWESITGLWDKVKTGFSERFTAMLNSFKDTIASIAEKIKGFFAKPFELMSDAIAGAKEKALDFARKIPGMKYIIGEKENIGTAKATINGSHANGLNYVPFDGYIAELHKGERVLTKDENESIFGSLRNRLQNATQSSKSENSTSSEKPITYQIYNSFTFNGVSEDTKNSIIENLQEKLNELQRQLEKMKEERETYARTSL